MLNDDILLSVLKNNFDKVITIINEEKPCSMEIFDVLTIPQNEIENNNTGRIVIDSINLKESDEYILEFSGRILKGEQDVFQIGNNTVRYIEFYDNYIGEIYLYDKVIPIEETDAFIYNETKATIEFSEFNLITDIKLKKINIKRLSNDFLEKDLVIQNSITIGIRDEDSEIGKFSCAIGGDVTASGECSYAEGYGTKATGINSHAEGENSVASNSRSHAEGCDTEATGYNSHAEGFATTASGNASHAEGNTTTASGDYSHAEGCSCEALRQTSHAEGWYTLAYGNYSHAEGAFTTAFGNYGSHAEGNRTTALGENSHTEGMSTNKVSNVINNFTASTSNDTIKTQWEDRKFSLAKGKASHVEGFDNLALGEASHAEGERTKSTYMFSHSEGYYSQALGQSAHAEGNSSTASGHYSHAECNTTTASGSGSHAEGHKTTASGNNSHAEGEGTQANGTDSHAEGAQTIANGNYQHVQGKYNIADTTNKYAHIVGNGNSTARSNAHTLDWDGNAWFKGNVSIDGAPTNDNELVTKKYVDEKSILEPLPIHTTNETASSIQYIVNIMDLDKRKTYGAVQHGIDKGTTYKFVYICDDGTQAMITSLGDGVNENPIRVWHYTNSSILYYGSYYYEVNYTNHATRTDVVVTRKIQKYLNLYNETEYTPSTDYNPATKKYVDDKFIGTNLEIVGTIPQSELQRCNDGTSRYISSIDFDTLFSEPNNYMYYATYKDDTLIPIEYQSNYNRMVTEELDSVDGMNVNIGFDYGTHKMYPFNGGNNSIKAYTFTNDLIIKRRPILNADMIATKEYVDKHVGNRIITVNNVNDSLTLTTNKLQHTTLTIPVEVILPTVTEYTEIHLFFNGSEGAELNTTNVKWESQLTIENNKSYEVVFTYVNDVVGWLAKSIIYS